MFDVVLHIPLVQEGSFWMINVISSCNDIKATDSSCIDLLFWHLSDLHKNVGHE